MAVRKEAPEASKARAYTIRVHIAAHPGEGNPACSLTALPPKFKSTRTDKIKLDDGKAQTGH